MIICPKCAAEYGSDQGMCPECDFSPKHVEGFTTWAPDLAYTGGGFEPLYFEKLAELEGGNFWFRSRNKLLIWAMKKYFPGMASFLEIGCGTGYVLQGMATAFQSAKMTGSEIFIEGLHCAAKRLPEAKFVQMDARAIPYSNEFDVVGAFDVLEHIDDDRQVLAELHRALKPGGGLLIAVPQHMWLWSGIDEISHHERRYARGEMQQKVSEAGFEVLRSTSFVSILLPLMALSRLSRKAPPEDPLSEFHIHRSLNAALEAALTVERILVQTGLNLPVGGSRLVVARKRH